MVVNDSAAWGLTGLTFRLEEGEKPLACTGWKHHPKACPSERKRRS